MHKCEWKDKIEVIEPTNKKFDWKYKFWFEIKYCEICRKERVMELRKEPKHGIQEKI